MPGYPVYINKGQEWSGWAEREHKEYMAGGVIVYAGDASCLFF